MRPSRVRYSRIPALCFAATRRGYRAAWQDGLVTPRRPIPAPLRLVVFDNDGVLVDSEHLSSATLAGVLTDLGVPYTREESHRDFTGGTLGHVRQVVEARGVALSPDFEATYARRLADVFAAELRPSVGVAELLDRLDARGIRYCVASNGTRGRIRASLRAAGLLERFAGRTFSAEDVARPKPAPDLFLHAAATLGIEPEACLVVEDTPPGVEAGRRAGMYVWAPASTYPERELEGADRVSPTMAALAAELDAELGAAGRRRSDSGGDG